MGSEHFSSSAKSGAGVVEIFRTIAEKIVEHQKNKKEEAPKKKVNTRGVLKVDGYTDFNPEMNVRITSKRLSVKEKKERSGCCGGKK